MFVPKCGRRLANRGSRISLPLCNTVFCETFTVNATIDAVSELYIRGRKFPEKLSCTAGTSILYCCKLRVLARAESPSSLTRAYCHCCRTAGCRRFSGADVQEALPTMGSTRQGRYVVDLSPTPKTLGTLTSTFTLTPNLTGLETRALNQQLALLETAALSGNMVFVWTRIILPTSGLDTRPQSGA